VNFFKDAPKLEVPVYFISGTYDYITTHTLTKEYFNFVEAPKKELIEFTNSAHCAIFEEPVKFNNLMINKVLNNIHQNIEENYFVSNPNKE
jgi:pimeloyl-ACP methyl ester carboxylesterase